MRTTRVSVWILTCGLMACGGGDTGGGGNNINVNANENQNVNENANGNTNQLCGNGVVDAGEACDDGNNVAGDGCSADCLTTESQCGNGELDAGEACDDGNNVDGDGCSADCLTVETPCGNGVIEVGEECDGNDLGGVTCEFLGFDEGTLACRSDCQFDLTDCGDCEPEICDGQDNDCDGVVDNGNPEGLVACDTGLDGPCAVGVSACQGGTLLCVQIVQSVAEVCDGTDNDCDGVVDNGDPEGGQACITNLLGPCATGISFCDAGLLSCVPHVMPSPEVCDGSDNDCNGAVDDGNPGGSQWCDTGQLGACSAGSTNCSGGALQCDVVVQATPEVCDGADNDCNGVVDDGDPGGSVACDTGLLGVCAAGLSSCAGGTFQCIQTMTGSGEVCDGQDNDCDGAANAPGGEVDGDGDGSLSCVDCDDGNPNNYPGNIEACDGQDNNCNGVADSPGGEVDGDGDGVLSCLDCNDGDPNNFPGNTEVCDGQDNDCDGMANAAGGEADFDNDGVLSCLDCADYDADRYPGNTELCDGKDNDCNPATLDGAAEPQNGAACDGADGDLCSEGVWSCVAGTMACSDTTGETQDICDGADNDCDPASADGSEDPQVGTPCDGPDSDLCEEGIWSCAGGTLVCSDNTGDTLDVCDGMDNDCNIFTADGQDEPTLDSACTTGLLGICSPGTVQCSAGALLCVQNEMPLMEICGNGIDEDCNGTADNSVDLDGDGYGHCDNDCCDEPGPCSLTPELINPGAYEFVGNGIDDDCDPSTSDTVPANNCASAVKWANVDGYDVAKAMELCQFTTPNPPQINRTWGVISVQQLFSDGSTPTATQLNNMQDWQAAVVANYGTAVAPQYGATMAGLSTGRMRDAGDTGFVVPQGGTTFGMSHDPPPVYWAAHGNTLPSSLGCNGNCTSGNNANDSINIRMTIRVPTNALSFSYKFKFYTAEYPEWTCTTYNDFYLALLTSGDPTIPADTNISFDANDNVFSVNNGLFDVCSPASCYTCPAGTGELAGTGMDGGVGGGSQWLITTAPVMGGEDIVLDLVIFDVGDNVYDSLVLLDDFQWHVNPATVGTVVVE
jgi:cysteine-rich repeat protein